MDRSSSEIIRDFHLLYYERKQRSTWRNTFWCGVPTKKNPMDLWMYQEIIFRTRPTRIVETGVARGGSTLYLAHLLDILGAGKVIGIDLSAFKADPAVRAHRRIELHEADSTDPHLIEALRLKTEGEPTMVILDSAHSAAHVREELRLYSEFVTVGHYLIVDDTHINGHPALRGYGEGPYEAVQTFLSEHPEFVVDDTCEKFMLTFSPRGFLTRIRQ